MTTSTHRPSPRSHREPRRISQINGICRGCRRPRSLTLADTPTGPRYATVTHRRQPPRWLRWAVGRGEWWPCPGAGRAPVWVPDTVYTAAPGRIDNAPTIIGVYSEFAWRHNRGGHYPTHDA